MAALSTLELTGLINRRKQRAERFGTNSVQATSGEPGLGTGESNRGLRDTPMKLLLIIAGGLLVALLIVTAAYGRNRRKRLARVLGGLDRAGIERILTEVLTCLRAKYPEFSLDRFEEAASLLEREFRPANEEFLAALPRGRFPNGFPDYWVVDMGILFGEMVRRHSLSASDWTQDDTGAWRLKFSLGANDFWWDPFKEAENRFTGTTPSLVMALKLIQTLK